ncbi:MAG: sodium-translocating pyrophosphatase [Candidatus Calescibacterium sp.]|nr:sodium-translocating pyrophosphatase [Candidatus Calescibacterium sp.]MCX7972442.1 sodium-translocating pyrophosphatase [bacterium]MDW8195667.1 sodium-translocating pyrophosphatase [Candidatus Calescibacterium sp.]
MLFLASEATIKLPQFTNQEYLYIFLVLISGIIGILFAGITFLNIMKKDPGNEDMQRIAAAIQEGANAYLSKQAQTMSIFVIILAIALFFLYLSIFNSTSLALGVSIAFLMGVGFSYAAGGTGMYLAVRANQRTAQAAISSYVNAMKIAFRAGSVAGMATVGLALLGAALLFLLYREEAVKVFVGFGFGGSLGALFMRVGGGIYTKAADVGADIVGKVEAGIPEDDPRNPAVIADNVGDNVGDCAGMVADVFESYAVTLVASIVLGVVVFYDQTFTNLLQTQYAWTQDMINKMTLLLVFYPLLVRAIGVITSIIGVLALNPKEDDTNPMRPINFGFWVSIFATIVLVFFLNFLIPALPTTPDWAKWFGQYDFRFFLATSLGVVLAAITLLITDYYTHIDKLPVTETSYSSKTGTATLILSGMAHGYQSSAWAVISIIVVVGIAFLLFPENLYLQMYAISLAGMGLLTTTGYILAMDTYGPISDNANGIFEMSGVAKTLNSSKPQEIIAKLDAVGNTTKALTKGLAIATAVFAAISLFVSYVSEAGLLKGIRIDQPLVFLGLLAGGAIPFFFASFTINAVGRSAFKIVEEVRRQFRSIPGLLEGKAKPEYGKCVSIATTAAQKELIGPGIVGVFSPILIGFLFGAEALGALLGGVILVGQLLAVYMANAGGLWDNAKKKIEEGFLGGKGTEYHKAAVVGDTVGDPLKDTTGPAINPLIKVINLVALLLAPVLATIDTINPVVRFTVIFLSIVILAIAVYISNKGSILDNPEAKEELKKHTQRNLSQGSEV